MPKTASRLATLIILSALLLPGAGLCAEAQKSPAAVKPQSVTKPKTAPAIELREKKGLKVDKNLPSTGVGKRVVANADFRLEGAVGDTPGVNDHNDRMRTGENDSVILISGWIECGDLQYNTAIPVFREAHLAFPDAPPTCNIGKNWLAQPKGYVWRYKYLYIFKETATRPECWNYFMSLDKLRLEVGKARLWIQSPYGPGQEMGIVGGGTREFPLSALKTKSPNGD